MRKSSILQQSASKKFTSPFLKPASSPAITKTFSEPRDAEVSSERSACKRSVGDIMKLFNQSSTTTQDTSKRARVEDSASELFHDSGGSSGCESQKRSRTPPPVLMQSPREASTPLLGASQATNKARYFSVVWCKKSMKKHKKWEGDAILIVKGRSATLKSLEGKELASTFGYTAKEVDAIEEGSLFSVGGKECEIQTTISAEEYLSGRCFSDGFVPTATREDSSPSSLASVQKTSGSPLSTVTIPAFRSPHVGSLSSDTSNKKIFNPPSSPVIKPDSLVMPRPNNLHQWDHNKKNLPVTDVVVEDSLARCLRPHQREGVVFLYECITQMRSFNGCGAILADEMGLGKTLQCIALIWTLLRQGPYGGQPLVHKVIIVTPSSLVKNWAREFKKWLVNRNLRVYYVEQNNKIDVFLKQPSLYPVLVLSYEMYMRTCNSLASVNFDLLICDEAHRLKNANIKTTESLHNLGTLRRILLTGTPVQNDLQEFFALVDFCNPGILGKASSFRRLYEEPILRSQLPRASEEEKELGQARANELMEVTTPFILRRTQDVIQSYLPGKVEYVVFCRPQPLQLTLYQNLLETNVVRACLSNYLSTDASCHLACILALRKLCNHPLLVSSKGFDDRDEDGGTSLALLRSEAHQGLLSDFDSLASLDLEVSSGKLRVLAAMLRSLWTTSPLERIVLVSNFTKMLDILQDHCAQMGYPFLRLDGSTSSAQRLEIVERFNSPHSNSFVFLLSCKAGGVGLNLVGANRIVLFDIDWNPANDLQAMARIWRDGQSRHVSIYRLLTTGTIEEKIFQRQVTKQDLSGAVLENKKDGKRVKFSLEDLRDLFTLDDATTSSTHRLLGCECDSLREVDDAARDGCLDDETQGHPGVASKPLLKRSSQLGTATTHSIIGKKLGMSDLLRWEHIPAPIGTVRDKSLRITRSSNKADSSVISLQLWTILGEAKEQNYDSHLHKPCLHVSSQWLILKDPHLTAAEDDITFVFRNFVSKPQKENDATEQPQAS